VTAPHRNYESSRNGVDSRAFRDHDALVDQEIHVLFAIGKSIFAGSRGERATKPEGHVSSLLRSVLQHGLCKSVARTTGSQQPLVHESRAGFRSGIRELNDWRRPLWLRVGSRSKRSRPTAGQCYVATFDVSKRSNTSVIAGSCRRRAVLAAAMLSQARSLTRHMSTRSRCSTRPRWNGEEISDRVPVRIQRSRLFR
jgi:hypothetical protein